MDSVEQDNNNANNSILMLRPETKKMIFNLMNPPKLLRTNKGLPRDWQGLAELCGIPGELMPSIAHNQDPTSKVLKLWYERSKTEATVEKLITYLEQLERYDVINDVLPLIEEDLKLVKNHSSNGKLAKIDPLDYKLDKDILTMDDVNLISSGCAPQRYDAFVLFDQEDIRFATTVIQTMEEQYDLKLCVKERDLVAGLSEHSAVIRLIAERCSRLIVIISPEFLLSNALNFFYDLAQSIAIDQRVRKIIPLIYKDCGKLPAQLDCYFKLDYRRTGSLFNFWDKLYESVKGPDKRRAKLSLPDNSLFPRADRSSELKTGKPISRSASNSEQFLSPSALKNKESSASRSSSVNFDDNTKVPQDTSLVPSTSTGNLRGYELGRFFKTFGRHLVSKLKPKNRSPTDQPSPDSKSEEKNNKETTIDGMNEKNEANDNQPNEVDIKADKKKKKRIFTLKRSKKKAMLAES